MGMLERYGGPAVFLGRFDGLRPGPDPRPRRHERAPLPDVPVLQRARGPALGPTFVLIGYTARLRGRGSRSSGSLTEIGRGRWPWWRHRGVRGPQASRTSRAWPADAAGAFDLRRRPTAPAPTGVGDRPTAPGHRRRRLPRPCPACGPEPGPKPGRCRCPSRRPSTRESAGLSGGWAWCRRRAGGRSRRGWSASPVRCRRRR